MITTMKKEGNTYDKFIKRRCLDRVRSIYHLSLEISKLADININIIET